MFSVLRVSVCVSRRDASRWPASLQMSSQSCAHSQIGSQIGKLQLAAEAATCQLEHKRQRERAKANKTDCRRICCRRQFTCSLELRSGLTRRRLPMRCRSCRPPVALGGARTNRLPFGCYSATVAHAPRGANTNLSAAAAGECCSFRSVRPRLLPVDFCALG